MKFLRELPARLRSDLQAEQFRILRTQVPILYAVLFINTGILCFSVYGSVPVSLSVATPGTFGALVIVRLVIWLTRRGAHPDGPVIRRYLISTTIIAAIVSLGLGVWGVALLNSEVGDKPFVPMFIAFGAIACTYCLASLPRAAFATIFLATAPIIVILLTSGVRLEVAAGVNLLLIFLLILRLVAHQYDYLVDRVISHAQVNDLANADPLTGLPNRRAFIERLHQVISDRSREDRPAAVAMIDLDGFKAINDTYGHAAGDAVLIQVAERIQTACKSCRMVARLGGDEFAALILGVDDVALVAGIGAALVEEIGKPFTVSGSQLRLAASIGLAPKTEDDTSAMALMSRADVALYEVKHGGGKGILIFTPAMGMRLRRRVLIEQALRETDPRPRIEVVYQPIFDARTRRITSFEALARWTHAELGPLSPLEFVSVAEQTGTIAALSEQIFAIAIQEATYWLPSIGLSINLSAIDLCRPGMPLMIMSLCNRYGFDPKRLEVEVTETSVLSDFEAARGQLELLRNSGIRVALDDFGSGFASISYLKEITFDRVKIDGELIANIMESSKERRLLQGILQLCASMGLPATAEKVETEDQLAVLVGLGCERLQGYLLSRPLDATAARALTDVMRKVA